MKKNFSQGTLKWTYLYSCLLKKLEDLRYLCELYRPHHDSVSSCIEQAASCELLIVLLLFADTDANVGAPVRQIFNHVSYLLNNH